MRLHNFRRALRTYKEELNLKGQSVSPVVDADTDAKFIQDHKDEYDRLLAEERLAINQKVGQGLDEVATSNDNENEQDETIEHQPIEMAGEDSNDDDEHQDEHHGHDVGDPDDEGWEEMKERLR